MPDDIFSSALNQAGQLGTVLVNPGPHAAVATAMAKATAALTDSEIPEAEAWDRTKSGGKSLKEIALKHGWERLAPGTYRDTSDVTPRIYYEFDPEDAAEQIVAEGL